MNERGKAGTEREGEEREREREKEQSETQSARRVLKHHRHWVRGQAVQRSRAADTWLFFGASEQRVQMLREQILRYDKYASLILPVEDILCMVN